MIRICDESSGQHGAIAELHRAAFGGDFEARLVDRLRQDGLVAASLVATDGGEAVGAFAEGD